MENQITKRTEQQLKASQTQLQKTSPLTLKALTKNTLKLKAAFPTLPEEFYDIFLERIKVHDFTDERLNKAIDRVIDTCVYPTPTIANFIQADKDINDSIPQFNSGPGR